VTSPDQAAPVVDVAGLLAYIARHGQATANDIDGDEPADGAIVLVDQDNAYVRTDEAADQAAGTWWKLDGNKPGDRSYSFGELLGLDDAPEDRRTHMIEQLFTVEDLARIVEDYARTVHAAQQLDAAIAHSSTPTDNL
jgi:hypothetical protein